MNVEDFQDLLYEVEDNGILTITINKPERRNAMSPYTFLEMDYALDRAEKDKKVKVVILTGSKEGNAFSSGGYFSMKALDGIPRELKKQIDFNDWTQKKLTLKLWDFSKPLIAAMNGLGIGAGFTIPALFADLVYASSDAWFGLYMIKRVVAPDFGSGVLMPLLVGMRKAKEMFYFGEKITAQKAEELCIVNKVLPPEKLMDFAREQAMRLMPPTTSTLAFKIMKKSLHSQFREMLEKECDLENKLYLEGMSSKDFQESIMALKEKRDPVFK